MRFHPFRPAARSARQDCPFCADATAGNGRPCNICRSAGVGAGK